MIGELCVCVTVIVVGCERVMIVVCYLVSLNFGGEIPLRRVECNNPNFLI